MEPEDRKWWQCPVNAQESIEDALQEMRWMREDWVLMAKAMGFDTFTDPESIIARAKTLRDASPARTRNEQIGEAIKEAARILPEGWLVIIDVENSAATVDLMSPEGERYGSPEVDSDNRLAASIHAATAHAIKLAEPPPEPIGWVKLITAEWGTAPIFSANPKKPEETNGWHPVYLPQDPAP